MERPHLRPRFRQEFPCSAEVVIQRLREKLAQSENICLWSLIHDHMVLCIPEQERHFWSPVLDLHIDALEQGTRVWGHFGPHPNVWTLFTALYAAFGFTGLIGLMFGLSQWIAREPQTGLFLLPVSLAGGLILWLAGRMGQKIAQSQMQELQSFFEHSLCEPQ